jgi:hypothetical protein
LNYRSYREESELKMFGGKVQRRIFGLKGYDIIEKEKITQ